jgi:HlyD family secretion protein
LAAATARQKIAQIAHDMTMRCETFTLPDGKKEKFCPGLGATEEQARYELYAANEELAAAQTRLDQLLAGPNQDQVDSARANVSQSAAQRDATQAQLDLLLAGPSEHQIAAAQAQIDQAQLALEMAQTELDKATLRAPLRGVVTAVNVRAGEMPPAALPVVVLADVSELQLVAKVDEIDVAQIREGQEVTIVVDALPGETLGGRVKEIAPAASQEGGLVVYQVTVVLDDTELPLRLGMSATAAIVVERLDGALLVPTWAIRIDQDTGQTFVDVLRGGVVEGVGIEIGVRGADTTQVLSGLQEGDVVVGGEISSLRDLVMQGE